MSFTYIYNVIVRYMPLLEYFIAPLLAFMVLFGAIQLIYYFIGVVRKDV